MYRFPRNAFRFDARLTAILGAQPLTCGLSYSRFLFTIFIITVNLLPIPSARYLIAGLSPSDGKTTSVSRRVASRSNDRARGLVSIRFAQSSARGRVRDEFLVPVSRLIYERAVTPGRERRIYRYVCI